MKTQMWLIALIFGISVAPIANTTDAQIFPHEAGVCENCIVPIIAFVAVCSEIVAGVFYLVQDQELNNSLGTNHTMPNLALQNKFHGFAISSGMANIISGFSVFAVMYKIGSSCYDKAAARALTFCAGEAAIGLTLGLAGNSILWGAANSGYLPSDIQNIFDQALESGLVPLITNAVSTTALATAATIVFVRLKKFSKPRPGEATRLVISH